MQTPSLPNLSRRQFLATTSAAAVLPALLPNSVFGQNRPSNRIHIGVIGWGMMGPVNTKAFLADPECRVVAACDIDKRHLKAAVNTINAHYKNEDCKAYHDFRELLASPDIDAVMIAVPDHWHALIAVEAARRKKDIYGEKPLARTIAEQQAIVRAVKENNVIFQTGSQQRSNNLFCKACEIVRNGLIGKVTQVEVGLPSGYNDFAKSVPQLLERLAALPGKATDLSLIVPGSPEWDVAVGAPPADLDYEMWIGPAQMEPYIEQRVLKNWRWNYNTGGGQLLDWVGHHVDIAHWGLGFDDSGPLEVEGIGYFPSSKAIWNTCSKYRIDLKYPQDVNMVIQGGMRGIQGGTKWIGPDGWVWVNRGAFNCSNPEWKAMKVLPAELRKVELIRSDSQHRNFIESVKSRQPTIATAEIGHRSAVPGHLGLISMLTGRKIRWDSQAEVILDDPEASKLLTREYRAPWKLV